MVVGIGQVFGTVLEVDALITRTVLVQQHLRVLLVCVYFCVCESIPECI